MADVTATSPGDMDPIQQASLSTSVSNVKSFAHAGDLVIQTLLTNMVNSQQSQTAFNQAIQSRCINMLLDPMNLGVSDALTGSTGAKVAQTTPPTYQDPTSSLAALAAQVSLLTQMIQGLNIAPASSSAAPAASAGAATPAEVAASTTKTG